jgi:P-type E1-E2 ATPase
MSREWGSEWSVEIAILALPALAFTISRFWPETMPFLAAATIIAVIPIALSAFRGLLERALPAELLHLIGLILLMTMLEWEIAAITTLFFNGLRLFQALAEKRVRRLLHEPMAVAMDRHAQRISTDGLVSGGMAHVEQSVLTGERRTLEKVSGDYVWAGSLIRAGSVDIQALASGEATVAARISRLQADTPKPSSIPILIMAGLALGSWFWLHDISMSIGLLLLASADPRSSSAPLAGLAVMASAARRGVIFKEQKQLERFAQMQQLALDKCGLFAQRVIRIGQLDHDPRTSHAFIWECLAVAEKPSEHAVGRSIFRRAVKEVGQVPHPEQFQQIPGKGVAARVSGHDLLVGTAELLRERKASFDGSWLSGATTTLSSNTTDVFIAVNGECVGRLRVHEEAPTGIKETVTALQELGLKRIVLLSRDPLRSTAHLALGMGIDEYHSGLKAEERNFELGRLARKGILGLVWDGRTDASAAQRADIKIVYGPTTLASFEAGDVILMGENLDRLPYALQRARRLHAYLKQAAWIWVSPLFIGAVLLSLGIAGPAVAALLSSIASGAPMVGASRLLDMPHGQSAEKT